MRTLASAWGVGALLLVMPPPAGAQPDREGRRPQSAQAGRAAQAVQAEEEAQEDPPQFTEEVTVRVTARKREENLQAVPFSVVAPTQQVLRNRGVDSIEDVSANVAGFSVQNLGPGQSQIAMRGVSAGQIVRDQPGVKEQVGVYLDESVISLSLFTPDLDLFDMSRIEVLRGPQGTLFGSGSLSGTVRYITNQPVIGVAEGAAEVGVSSLHGGGLGNSAKFAVNVPLGPAAAARVTAYNTVLGGFIDAVQPGLNVNENVDSGLRRGTRVAFRLQPYDRLSITPRLIYQNVSMNGWNRIDAYNILANPFTTTRPPVTLGERRQFTQLDEPFTDAFLLGDFTLEHDLGGAVLTSITSLSKRDVEVVRDASALGGSVSFSPFGAPEAGYTLDFPLIDITAARGLTQEFRAAADGERLDWVLGSFYSTSERRYGQSAYARTTWRSTAPPSAISCDSSPAPRTSCGRVRDRWRAVPIRKSSSIRTSTTTSTDRAVRGGLARRHRPVQSDRRTSLVRFRGGAHPDVRRTVRRSARQRRDHDGDRFRAAGHSQLRRDRGDTGERPGVEGVPTRRHQRSPQYSDLFRRGPCHLRQSRHLGRRGAVELRGGLQVELAGRPRYVQRFRVLHGHSQPAGHRDGRHLLVAHHLQRAGSPERRGRAGAHGAADPFFDLAVSASVADARLESTVTSTDAAGAVNVVSGIESGRRLPTTPMFQAAAAATWRWLAGGRWVGYVSGIFQHVGSRFTQVGDQAAGFGSVDLTALSPVLHPGTSIGGPLTQSTFTFDPELPAYNILNLRVGFLNGLWDVAFFADNLTDERALLGLDQERGTLARVGYLTNPPRSLGISTRVGF